MWCLQSGIKSGWNASFENFNRMDEKVQRLICSKFITRTNHFGQHISGKGHQKKKSMVEENKQGCLKNLERDYAKPALQVIIREINKIISNSFPEISTKNRIILRLNS